VQIIASALASKEMNAAAVRKKVVIVGAGWAGFGAAKHLSEQGTHCELLHGMLV
jgi:cation diffusion facilitator CzcD-associated flavoprotein CzcO